MGDVHPLGSPHFTLDPANMPRVTATLVEGLSRVAPELAGRLEANRRAFLERVAAASPPPSELLAAHGGARIVSHRDSWPYFLRGVRPGRRQDHRGSARRAAVSPAPLGPHPIDEGDPGRAILSETWYLADTARAVARETGRRWSCSRRRRARSGHRGLHRPPRYLVTRIADALK